MIFKCHLTIKRFILFLFLFISPCLSAAAGSDFSQLPVSSWYNSLWAYAVYLFLIWLIIFLTMRIHLRNQQRRIRKQKEADRHAEEVRLQEMRQEMLEQELKNKTHELMLQTSLLVRKSRIMHELLEELENQKETMGERYPNKLYRRMKNMIEGSLNDQNDWLAFETYFNNAHHDFIQRLQQQYDELTPADIRICCLIRMNLSTKEIASVLNISVRAVELRRYRLRKRMNLDGDVSLPDYLIGF
ncbi:MAG: LuxR C-terminal-related transcriptional regulator [Tannerellaceae bacterium]|nr:LuxR C-terminal-related transcriptional regulator [Tannerellaceae bacterium]